MSYSTNTTILILLPGLPQTTSSTPQYTATTAVIDQHIVRADNIINGKIVKRYEVKNFSTAVPPLLKNLSEDITCYYTFRSLWSQDNQNKNDWVDKFQDAIAVLDEIRDGKIDLVDSSGNLITEKSEDESTAALVDSNTKSQNPFFNIDSELDWSFDSDAVESVRDER